MPSPPLLFQTERLDARHLTADDFDAMYAVYRDPIGARYVDDGHPITREETIRWIAVTLLNYTQYGYGMTALVLRATGNIAGFIGLVHPGGQPKAELKYSFRREHWGQGFATEAARGMIAYGRDTFGLRHVIATTDPENTPSHRVLEKTGFRRGELRPDDAGLLTQVFVLDAPPPAV